MTSAPAFSFIPQGAILEEFLLPPPPSAPVSKPQNIVLSLPNPHFYYHSNSAYIGETIGRTTNRIANAAVHNLNGRTYKLAANNSPNNLHGGEIGWGKRVWAGPTPVQRRSSRGEDKEAAQFAYVSPDGEEGFPGTVEAKVWYIGWEEEEAGDGKAVCLEMEYEVSFCGDGPEGEETIVGLTNHRYALSNSTFILAGTLRLHLPSYEFSLISTILPILRSQSLLLPQSISYCTTMRQSTS